MSAAPGAATKVVFALWRQESSSADVLAKSLLGHLPGRLADLGVTRAQVNVSDSAVASAMLRLTAFPEPVDAVVSVWLEESERVAAVEAALGEIAGAVAGWFVEETVPLPPPVVPLGQRSAGLANVAFLRRPDGMGHAAWLDDWLNRHTAVAIETQATCGYVQNHVLGPATPDAPSVDGIVEELFPIEALTDVHAFYGSHGDPDELWRRVTRMLESVIAFGADRAIDVVPTSRYRVV